MRIDIRYLCFDDLSDESRSLDVKAIHRFPEIVSKYVPELQFDVSELDAQLQPRLLDAFRNTPTLKKCFITMNEVLSLTDDEQQETTKLVICCDSSSWLAKWAMTESRGAYYGVATANQFAITYCHDPRLIWHEMLHLLYAKDCYIADESGDPIEDCICGNDQCLMQNDPTHDSVEIPPLICSQNVEVIRNWIQTSEEFWRNGPPPLLGSS
jgi:hypothetical protein